MENGKWKIIFKVNRTVVLMQFEDYPPLLGRLGWYLPAREDF